MIQIDSFLLYFAAVVMFCFGMLIGHNKGEKYGYTVGYAKGVEDGLKGKDIYLEENGNVH